MRERITCLPVVRGRLITFSNVLSHLHQVRQLKPKTSQRNRRRLANCSRRWNQWPRLDKFFGTKGKFTNPLSVTIHQSSQPRSQKMNEPANVASLQSYVPPELM